MGLDADSDPNCVLWVYPAHNEEADVDHSDAYVKLNKKSVWNGSSLA